MNALEKEKYPYQVDFDTKSWLLYKRKLQTSDGYYEKFTEMKSWIHSSGGKIIDKINPDHGIYISMACFKHEEDLLIFKLKFGGYL